MTTLALQLAAIAHQAHAAELLQAPTRVTSYDWQCQDKSNAKLSDHARFDTALTACYNNPAGDHIQGGTYRLPPRNVLPPTDTTPPGVPGNFKLNLSASDVVGTWDASTDNVGVAAYEVWRCFGAGCTNVALIGSYPVPGLNHKGIAAGLTATYQVRAVDAAGNLSAYTPALSVTIPKAPASSVTLSWRPPTINTNGSVLTDLAGYRIVFGRSPDVLTQTVQVANPALASFIVTELSSGTWYFGIKAYSASGSESDLSNVTSKTITAL